MAPNPLDTAEERIKKAIQSLYLIQSSTYGYAGDESQAVLVQEATNLAESLASLQTLAQPSRHAPAEQGAASSSSIPGQLPPEVIMYVDDGRNPDIYTREFVELVQRGNAYLKGKSEAVASLRDAVASELVAEWPEWRAEVEKVVGKPVEPAERMESQNSESKVDVIKS